jgi:hypothetical protein
MGRHRSRRYGLICSAGDRFFCHSAKLFKFTRGCKPLESEMSLLSGYRAQEDCAADAATRSVDQCEIVRGEVNLLKNSPPNKAETNQETDLQRLSGREWQAKGGAGVENYFFSRLLAVRLSDTSPPTIEATVFGNCPRKKHEDQGATGESRRVASQSGWPTNEQCGESANSWALRSGWFTAPRLVRAVLSQLYAVSLNSELRVDQRRM